MDTLDQINSIVEFNAIKNKYVLDFNKIRNSSKETYELLLSLPNQYFDSIEKLIKESNSKNVEFEIINSPEELRIRFPIRANEFGKLISIKVVAIEKPNFLYVPLKDIKKCSCGGRFEDADGVFECKRCGNVVPVKDIIKFQARDPQKGAYSQTITCELPFSIVEKKSINIGNELEILGIFTNSNKKITLSGFYCSITDSNIKNYDYIEKFLEDLDEFQFEEVVAEIYRKLGYEAKVTKKTGDKGMDIIASKENEVLAIQCKHNKGGGVVGSPTIQNALGSVIYPHNADKIVIVTSSKFSRDAIEMTRNQKEHKFILIDGVEIRQLIAEHYLGIKDVVGEKKLVISDFGNSEVQKQSFVILDRLSYYFKKTRGNLNFGAFLDEIQYDIRTKDPDVFIEAFKEATKVGNYEVQIDFSKAKDLVSQKISGSRVDPDRHLFGIMPSERGKIFAVHKIINLLNEKGRIIPINDVIKEAEQEGISVDAVEEAIEKLKRSGDIFECRSGFISKF